jgi:hypothetical protein
LPTSRPPVLLVTLRSFAPYLFSSLDSSSEILSGISICLILVIGVGVMKEEPLPPPSTHRLLQTAVVSLRKWCAIN